MSGNGHWSGTNSLDIASKIQTSLNNIEHDRNFSIIELLGESSYSRNELVADSLSGRLCVRKEQKFQGLEDLEARFRFFENLKGKQIPQCSLCLDVYSIADSLIVVSEYIPGANLNEFVAKCAVNNLSKKEYLQLIQIIFQDLFTATNALHNEAAGPIVHRDINPNNVIVGQGSAFLIDLGIARRFQDSKTSDTQLFGTSGYAAPEQYGFGQTTQVADIYALGMLLYFVLTGNHPTSFLSRGFVGLAEYPSFGPVIKKAIAFDPTDRYSNVNSFEKAFAKSYQEEMKRLKKVGSTRLESKGKPHIKLFSVPEAESKRSQFYEVLKLVWNIALCGFLALLGLCFVLEIFFPGEILETEHPYYFALDCLVLIAMPTFFSLDFFQVYKRLPIIKKMKGKFFLPLFFATWLVLVCVIALSTPTL